MLLFIFMLDLTAFAFGFWAAGHFASVAWLNHNYRDAGVSYSVRPSMYVVLLLSVCWGMARLIAS